MRLSRAGVVACLALGLAATACAEASPRTSKADAADLGLSAEVVYGRHAAVRGKVDVRVANAGDGDVEVTTLQLRTPLYATVPPLERASTLPPDGAARTIPVPFGDVRCDQQRPAGAHVLLGVRTAEGVVDVPVPVVDGEPGLVRAHRLSCASAAVDRAARLELGPAVRRDDGGQRPLLRTTLEAARQGEGEVTVTQLLGNILFDVTVASSPLLRLEQSAQQAQVEVAIAATRCDPHALTESKTSFTFPLFAALDGDEEVATSVTATGDLRAALQALLDDTCGAP